MTEKWRDVCTLEELADTRPHRLRVNETEIVLVRHADKVFALSGLCPHDHARLCDGHVSGETLVCPRHGARFRLADGGAEPGFRLAPLTCYDTRLHQGRVQLQIADLEKIARVRWDLTNR